MWACLCIQLFTTARPALMVFGQPAFLPLLYLFKPPFVQTLTFSLCASIDFFHAISQYGIFCLIGAAFETATAVVDQRHLRNYVPLLFISYVRSYPSLSRYSSLIRAVPLAFTTRPHDRQDSSSSHDDSSFSSPQCPARLTVSCNTPSPSPATSCHRPQSKWPSAPSPQ